MSLLKSISECAVENSDSTARPGLLFMMDGEIYVSAISKFGACEMVIYSSDKPDTIKCAFLGKRHICSKLRCAGCIYLPVKTYASEAAISPNGCAAKTNCYSRKLQMSEKENDV